MPKVLGQNGTSLADLYDVEGSIAGVEELLSREVSLQHEMGGTIFSERLLGSLNRLSTNAIVQNSTWDLTAVAAPGIYRVLGVFVMTDVALRVLQAQVSIRGVRQEREIPILIWDSTNDGSRAIRISDNGAPPANAAALVPTIPQTMPSLGIGVGQRLTVGRELVFRGLTSGFGAGTVTVTALIYLAFTGGIESPSLVSGSNSGGLPIPAW